MLVEYFTHHQSVPFYYIQHMQVVAVVKERIGLLPRSVGFSLFEVFGQLERNMLPIEKVADAMFKWEKYARSTHSPKTLKLTFKVHTTTLRTFAFFLHACVVFHRNDYF